jgi:hypothetical protein
MVALLDKYRPAAFAAKAVLHQYGGCYFLLGFEVSDVTIKPFANVLCLKGTTSNLDTSGPITH